MTQAEWPDCKRSASRLELQAPGFRARRASLPRRPLLIIRVFGAWQFLGQTDIIIDQIVNCDPGLVGKGFQIEQVRLAPPFSKSDIFPRFI
jgi:hypothetical protein